MQPYAVPISLRQKTFATMLLALSYSILKYFLLPILRNVLVFYFRQVINAADVSPEEALRQSADIHNLMRAGRRDELAIGKSSGGRKTAALADLRSVGDIQRREISRRGRGRRKQQGECHTQD